MLQRILCVHDYDPGIRLARSWASIEGALLQRILSMHYNWHDVHEQRPMNEYVLLMELGCWHRDWTNPSLQRVSPNGGVPLVGPQEELRATWPEWIYSQGFHFKPRAGGEVRIFGFYNNKQKNKDQITKLFMGCLLPLSFILTPFSAGA